MACPSGSPASSAPHARLAHAVLLGCAAGNDQTERRASLELTGRAPTPQCRAARPHAARATYPSPYVTGLMDRAIAPDTIRAMESGWAGQ